MDYELVSIADYRREELRWVWPLIIPAAKLTLLSGDPSVGKSFVTLDIAARVSSGATWPDGSVAGKPASVLLLSAEDDVADTIRPRLEHAQADLKRVFVLAANRRQGRLPLSLHRDLDRLTRLLDRHADCRLLVIDPISAYLDGLAANSDTDVRSLLSRLANLAARRKLAVILVSHWRKNGSRGPAMHRTIGSVAFTAVARSAWNVLKDPTEPGRRLLLPVKLNVAPSTHGLAYRIVDPGRVEWEPEPIEVAADESGSDAWADTDSADRLTLARDWLFRALMNGPRTSNDVKRAARAAGVGQTALWAAKKSLGVVAVKQPNPRPNVWLWKLPVHHIPDTDPALLLGLPLTGPRHLSHRELANLRMLDQILTDSRKPGTSPKQ